MIRHHASLLDDLARDRTLAAACRRRAARSIGNGAAMVAALVAAGVLALHQPADDDAAAVTGIPPEKPAGEADTGAFTPACHHRASDDELLEALADQGPMLVTATDGRRYLVLARPN